MFENFPMLLLVEHFSIFCSYKGLKGSTCIQCFSYEVDYKMNNKDIWLRLIIICLIFFNYFQVLTSRRINNKRSEFDKYEFSKEDLLANPVLLEQLTKPELENLLQNIEKEENATKIEGDGEQSHPFLSFEELILQDFFSETSSKEDLEALTEMLNNILPPDTKEEKTNSTSMISEMEQQGQSSQTQSQSQNLSIITNVYNEGAGGEHHHRHYHLLLLSDDGKAQGKHNTY